jgi:type II secretory pathway pseudopilin PulG
VIVVLVILAILAAIAIPALTGYIDKTKWMKFEQENSTFRTAFQTMIIMEMANNGGTIPLYNSASPQNYFASITVYNPSETDPAKRSYLFRNLTNAGKTECNELTGSSVPSTDTAVLTGPSGTIKTFRLTYSNYFGQGLELFACWRDNLSDDDPYMEILKAGKTKAEASYDRVLADTYAPGFNAYKVNINGSGWSPTEKVY